MNNAKDNRNSATQMEKTFLDLEGNNLRISAQVEKKLFDMRDAVNEEVTLIKKGKGLGSFNENDIKKLTKKAEQKQVITCSTISSIYKNNQNSRISAGSKNTKIDGRASIGSKTSKIEGRASIGSKNYYNINIIKYVHVIVFKKQKKYYLNLSK